MLFPCAVNLQYDFEDFRGIYREKNLIQLNKGFLWDEKLSELPSAVLIFCQRFKEANLSKTAFYSQFFMYYIILSFILF